MPRLVAYLSVVLLTLALACQDRSGRQQGPLPETPEAVVRQYQSWYDANHYQAAKRLSTPREARRLDELAIMLDDQDADSTLLQTRFLDMQCRAKEAIAFCYCLLEDEYERYQTLFTLRRIDGQWLVDAPDAEASPSEEVQQAFDELMQDIELGNPPPGPSQ